MPLLTHEFSAVDFRVFCRVQYPHLVESWRTLEVVSYVRSHLRMLSHSLISCRFCLLNDHLQAEEDAAALRAEIKLLQASEDQSESLGAIAEQLRLAEQHNNTLQKELQVRYIQMYMYCCDTVCELIFFHPSSGIFISSWMVFVIVTYPSVCRCVSPCCRR